MIYIDISGATSTLLLSEYGERMHWSCPVPNFEFDPGDGNPIVLRINCLNSVDTSTVLEIVLSWFRLVSSNGMMFGLGDSRLRRRHIQSLDPEDIGGYLNDKLAHVATEEGLYKSWRRTEVKPAILMGWVDGTIAREWGPHAGARVWKIINEGSMARWNTPEISNHLTFSHEYNYCSWLLCSGTQSFPRQSDSELDRRNPPNYLRKVGVYKNCSCPD